MHDIDMSCPAELEPYRLAYELEKKQTDDTMYQMGIYIIKSIECTIGNMFKKKGAKAIEYLKKPLMQLSYENRQVEEMTEEEKRKARMEYTLKFRELGERFKRKKGSDNNV